MRVGGFVASFSHGRFRGGANPVCYAILDESISHSSRLWVEPCRQRRRVGDLSIAGNPGGAGVTTTMNVPWLEENVTRVVGDVKLALVGSLCH